MYFDNLEFMVMHKCSAYYASIMLNAFRHLLCSLLCQHNRWVPSNNSIQSYDASKFFKVGNLRVHISYFCMQAWNLPIPPLSGQPKLVMWLVFIDHNEVWLR